MTRRWWFVVAMLAAVVVGGMRPATQGRAAGASQASTHLYIVFLPGLCGWSGSDRYCKGTINAAARATGTFRTLIAALGAAKIKYIPIFYSYNPGHTTYSVGDTHSSVARDVSGLEGQLRAVAKKDSLARFVLAGHSLGGVVAASWAVSNGRRYGYDPQNGLLRSTLNIVTFDSPLKGLYGRFWTSPVTRFFGGTVWYSLQTSSETIKEIVFFPESWWKSTGHLHTIANSADEIIPPPESLLGDKKLVFDSKCPTDILVFRSCHGAVLDDAALNRYVACHWVTGPYACSPAPTPTRTPAATKTPTALPTSTPTAVPSPTVTDTPVVSLPPPP